MPDLPNRYKADLREIRFRLFEQLHLDDLLGKAPYENWSKDDVEMILDEVYKWSCAVLGPLNPVGDRQGCTFKDGAVTPPDGFKAAWDSLFDAGWRSLAVSEEMGGQGGPLTLHIVAEEMMAGANTAFSMYPALAQGVAEVIHRCGTPEQAERYAKPLFAGKAGGTMCLTEPHAGSDVGANTTRAIRQADGRYKIEGTKIFISGGDQNFTDNIFHLVLARTDDAPPGTKGLSLFIVPKLADDGSSNDVAVGSIEHKMGINGSATCVLNFGENNSCFGELVGTEEQKGMSMMFQLMNFARIGVGVQGVSLASAAYLSALDYAKERKQGPNIANWKDPTAPKVPIIQHPDVRRMLLDMKARVEGIRALVLKLAIHTDRQVAAELAGDDKAAQAHQGQVDLLVPLVKAYGSDQGFQVAATAIQVFGGAGYLKDHPVEQYCRDAKIFSIYEGTNHIQALDLVGRKLSQKGGANFQAFLGEVNAFVKANQDNETYRTGLTKLGAAAEALMSTAMRLWNWFRGGEKEMVPLIANRFLEMMAETTVAWLLLDGAIIADSAAAKLPEDHPDRAFYAGKRHAAVYYAHNVLPGVTEKAAILAAEDKSALDIPEAAF
ncbi:MAG TPA: acyl-CoA dehydrogenase [Kofleriaceae bacterium]|nr:acyl-CoA dehydrogenase [Kofleriaceae bacterium]